MDARRLELYELLKPKLDEEPARALVLALPDDAASLATKDDLAAAFERFGARMDARFAQMDARFESLVGSQEVRFTQMAARFESLVGSQDARFAQMDARFESLVGSQDARFAQMDARFESLVGSQDVRFAHVDARFAQMETTLTKRMITIMGAWTIFVGSTTGWLLALFR